MPVLTMRQQQPSLAADHDADDLAQVYASISHLLSRAYQLPCSTAAQAFTQLVQPRSTFQVALETLVPLLDPGAGAELEKRILVCFILYSLYTPHPIAINPFRSVLLVTFVKEKDADCNEQLVWVLWKILKGDGNDIGPYSPTTLARSPLPPKLKAANLTLDDDLCNNNDIENFAYNYSISPSKDQNCKSIDWDSPDLPPPPPRWGVEDQKASTLEEIAQNKAIAQATGLLLQARERVLTLSEQREVLGLIKPLAESGMVTPLDFVPIVSTNPTLAHPLFVASLQTSINPSQDSEEEEGAFPIPNPPSSISPYLEILCTLPPTLPSFDLMGHLLRDDTPLGGNSKPLLKDLIKQHVLNPFIHSCITHLERIQTEQRQGERSDDAFEMGTKNLCRFYTSLLRNRVVELDYLSTEEGEAEVVEMLRFSLENSGLYEAGVLYRMLVVRNGLGG